MQEHLRIDVLADVQQVPDALGKILAEYAQWAVLVILLLIGLFVLRKILKWRRRRSTIVEPDLTIDVSSLDCAGPPAEGPILEFHNIPVRLAVLVLAPVGRGHELPPSEEISAVVEMVLPGLSRIVETHRPLYRRWPAQLSWRAFTHTFFAHVKLPGDDGRGTPWSSVAGLVKTSEGSVMAGLVVRSEQATGLGHETIEEEGEWLRILQIKSS